MSIPLIAINSCLLRDPAELKIHNIMLKLSLNPNYKQVLGELSRPVSTGSTPGQRPTMTSSFPGGCSNLSFVRMSGPKFQPPPYLDHATVAMHGAPLILCCDQFDGGSRQVKRDPVDLVMEDYVITLR